MTPLCHSLFKQAIIFMLSRNMQFMRIHNPRKVTI